MAHIRESRPDSGLIFQVKVLVCREGVPLPSEADLKEHWIHEDLAIVYEATRARHATLRAKMARIRHSRQDSGLTCEIVFLEMFPLGLEADLTEERIHESVATVDEDESYLVDTSLTNYGKNGIHFDD